MKYLAVALALFLVGTYAALGTELFKPSRTVVSSEQILDKTTEIYFMGGQISCMCLLMQEHPEIFKPGQIESFKDQCANQYKDFETFDKAIENDTIKRMGAK